MKTKPKPVRPTSPLVLLLMVKDEAHSVGATIASFAKYVDAVFLYDTGSTDDTIKNAGTAARETDLPIMVGVGPFENFGQARTDAVAALHRACFDETSNEGGSTFTLFKRGFFLFVDADWSVISWEQKDKWPTDADSDSKKVLGEIKMRQEAGEIVTEYNMYCVGKIDQKPIYKDPVHEFMVGDESFDSGFYLTYKNTRSRASQTERFKRDIEMLKASMEKDPDNSRYVHYLASTYKHLGMYPEALAAFEKRAGMTMDGNFYEETFSSFLEAGKLHVALKHDTEVCEKALLDAFLYRPTRAEPFFYLAALAVQQKDLPKAFAWALQSTLIPYNGDKVALEKSVYDWQAMYIVAMSAPYAGEHGKGKQAAKIAFERCPKEHPYRADVENIYRKYGEGKIV